MFYIFRNLIFVVVGGKPKVQLKAIYWYRKLLDIAPDNDVYCYEFGVFLHSLGEYREALELLNKVSSVDKETVESLKNDIKNKLNLTQ